MPSRVYKDEVEVIPLLVRMLIPRWVLLEIASKIAGERANVAECEPPPVAGYEVWRWGTRFCRADETLRENGLGSMRSESGFRHPERKGRRKAGDVLDRR
jgi:hypothetical protein